MPLLQGCGQVTLEPRVSAVYLSADAEAQEIGNQGWDGISDGVQAKVCQVEISAILEAVRKVLALIPASDLVLTLC